MLRAHQMFSARRRRRRAANALAIMYSTTTGQKWPVRIFHKYSFIFSCVRFFSRAELALGPPTENMCESAHVHCRFCILFFPPLAFGVCVCVCLSLRIKFERRRDPTHEPPHTRRGLHHTAIVVSPPVRKGVRAV